MGHKLKIDELITEEHVEAALGALVECIGATKMAKQSGRSTFEEMPDFPTRKAAAETLLSFKFGRPHTSSTNLNFNVANEKRKGSMLPAAVVAKMVENGVDIRAILLETSKTEETIDI